MTKSKISTGAVANRKQPADNVVHLQRKRFSVALSGLSVQAFNELKRLTDADTESEVFRNALRLHATLLRAQIAGKRILVQDDNGNEAVPVNLFVQHNDAGGTSVDAA